jgi:hypothetical protein
MKKEHISFVVAVAILICLPQITFASWWSPTSWGIWNIIFGRSQVTDQTITPSTSTSSLQVDNATNTEVTSSQLINATTSSQTKIPRVRKTTPSIQKTIYCNGSSWNKCSTGESFVCPVTGDAYCQPLQVKTVITTTTQNIPTTSSSLSSTQSTPTNLIVGCASVKNFITNYKNTEQEITTGLQNASQGEIFLAPPNSATSLPYFQTAMTYFNSASASNMNNQTLTNIPFVQDLYAVQNTLTQEINDLTQATNMDEQIAVDGEDGVVGLQSLNASTQAMGLMQQAQNLNTTATQQITLVAQDAGSYFPLSACNP